MLFTAGILPSLLIGVIDAAVRHGLRRGGSGCRAARPRDWATILKTSKDAAGRSARSCVIFGGIYGGVFTPTEAAGVAVVYSLFVTMFIYREVDLAGFWPHPDERRLSDRADPADRDLGRHLFMAADHQRHPAADRRRPSTRSGMPRWELLLMLNAGLLLAGSFLEPPAAILILTPLLLPIVRDAGVNPIHFGIIVAVNLSLGMYTPPFGLNLFSSQAIFEAPLGRIYLGVLPFLVVNFAALMLITYVPAISMVLVGGY